QTDLPSNASYRLGSHDDLWHIGERTRCRPGSGSRCRAGDGQKSRAPDHPVPPGTGRWRQGGWLFGTRWLGREDPHARARGRSCRAAAIGTAIAWTVVAAALARRLKRARRRGEARGLAQLIGLTGRERTRPGPAERTPVRPRPDGVLMHEAGREPGEPAPGSPPLPSPRALPPRALPRRTRPLRTLGPRSLPRFRPATAKCAEQ